MSANKDYYQVLGVNKNASQDEIKQAYRKLAREHHPDMVQEKDKESAEKRFKEINEAYQVLSDPQKRKMYDQFGSAGPNMGGQGGAGFNTGQWGPFSYSYSSQGAGGSPFEDFDPFDVFESFFGTRGFGGRSPRKGKNLYYEMSISFSDAVFGIDKEISIDSGPLHIKIPAGVRDGTELRFAGRGMPGPSGVPAGDLFITLHINMPKGLDVVGDNILTNVEIDFVTATIGGEVLVPVVDLSVNTGLGTSKLKIPAGTQPGTQFLIRGKGMPRLRGHGQGDAIVQVFIPIPKKVSKKQKELLEEYKNSL